MKKTLAILLALAMLLALTACGTGGSGDPTEEPTDAATGEPQQTQTDAPEATEEPTDNAAEVTLPLTTEDVTFNIWSQDFNDNCYNYFDDNNDTVWYQELERRTGVHVEFTNASGTEGAEQFAILVSAGDLDYDGVVSVGTVYGSGAAGAYEDGIIVNLMDYVDYIPNYMAVLNSEEIYYKNSFDTAGHLFAFEKFFTLDTVPSMGLVIRQDWLDDLNMEAPFTIDEYHDVLTAFKTEEGTRSALWINYRGNTVGGMFGNAYDVDTYYGPTQGYEMFYQIDGKIHWTPVEEGFRDYLTTMSDWYAEGLIYPDFCAEVGDELIPDPSVWAQEQPGVCFAPNGLIPVAGMWAGEGANYTGAYAPHLTHDQTTHFLVGTQYVMSGHGLYMTTTCENKELFCRWADWLYSEEGQFLKNYGVEGESWEMVDGEPQLSYSAIFEDFDGSNNATLQWYLGGDSLWTINNTNLRNINLTEECEVAYSRWAEQNDIEYNLPYGLQLSVEESQEVNNILGDLATYVEECWPAFIMGQKSMDQFDDFVDTCYSLGAQKCIDLYQAALDRYNG